LFHGIKPFESVGGKVEALYFAFGDVDVYVIVDVPDNVSALLFPLLPIKAARL
jgi:uncharacterized protein with GYD domain